ncbi:jg6269 [Pararge aegeria aegeria]|uniref:Jg6269 protein n=1 Tax=Pararge aegeria aegeria TaxID=348720 RepID=A0A8S4SHQ4_9NEOP|nr:jg6269 [Pararge aegeria aegeria]
MRMVENPSCSECGEVETSFNFIAECPCTRWLDGNYKSISRGLEFDPGQVALVNKYWGFLARNFWLAFIHAHASEYIILRMLRIPWTAHWTNASILRQLKITRRLSTTCLHRILEYFGHIARRDGDNILKIVVTGKVEGNGPRGCSPIRWSDQIRTALDTKVLYGFLKVAIQMAQNPPKDSQFMLAVSDLQPTPSLRSKVNNPH